MENVNNQSLDNVKKLVEELVIKKFKRKKDMSFSKVLRMCSDKVHEELKFTRKTKSKLFEQINATSMWKENLHDKIRKF